MKIKTARILAALDYNHKVTLVMGNGAASNKVHIMEGKGHYSVRNDSEMFSVDKEKLIDMLERNYFFIESWYA